MRRSDVAGVGLVALVALVGSAASLGAQKRGTLIQAAGGVSLVVVRSTGTEQPAARVAAPSGTAFRSLSQSIRQALLSAGGYPAPAQPGGGGGGGFKITSAGQLLVTGAGGGWVSVQNANVSPGAVPLAGFLERGELEVSLWGNPTAKSYMVHFQVKTTASSGFHYKVTNPLDGTETLVDAKLGGTVQDIVVLMTLPDGQPITHAYVMARLGADVDRPGWWYCYGVEVTPI